MGGMAAGDVASNIVIAAMAPLDEDVPGNAMIDALRGAVENANQQIRDTVEANPAMEGMGTTLTAMLFGGSKFGMVHIGDSRAYLLRDGEFGQVTKDDTYVQMLVDEGRISLEEADSHPQRHLLFRALDGRDAEPEYSVRQAIPGDRYLLCSDGLSSVVSAETIEGTLCEYANPGQCAERLVQLALRGGGPDNITVIVADVTDQDIVEEAPIVGGAAARDRGNTTSADSSTPAARASALAGPRPAAPEMAPDSDEDDDDARPRRHPVRTTLLLLLLLGLLGGGVWGGWRYTQSQYYVGATDDGVVAVFRGVPGQVGGVHLSTEQERSSTTLDELTQSAQDAVKEGIHANNASDARRKLTLLTSDDPQNSNKLPPCVKQPSTEPSGPTQSPTPGAAPTAGASSSATADTTQTPSPTISCRRR
jgi:protein phosphatase